MRPEAPTLVMVDGRIRPTKNNLGRLIHQTEEGIKNFWRWFGDSQAVDSLGQPIVTYHGTNEQFSAFKVGRGEGGVFFTTNREAAMDYGDRVIAVYSRLMNPLRVSAVDWALAQNLSEEDAKAAGYDGMIILDHDVGGAPETDEIYSTVGDTFVVFDPAAVKSASRNPGTFDPNNPSFYDTPEETLRLGLEP